MLEVIEWKKIYRLYRLCSNQLGCPRRPYCHFLRPIVC